MGMSLPHMQGVSRIKRQPFFGHTERRPVDKTSLVSGDNGTQQRMSAAALQSNQTMAMLFAGKKSDMADHYSAMIQRLRLPSRLGIGHRINDDNVADADTLKALLSHNVPEGDAFLESDLAEALACIETLRAEYMFSGGRMREMGRLLAEKGLNHPYEKIRDYSRAYLEEHAAELLNSWVVVEMKEQQDQREAAASFVQAVLEKMGAAHRATAANVQEAATFKALLSADTKGDEANAQLVIDGLEEIIDTIEKAGRHDIEVIKTVNRFAAVHPDKAVRNYCRTAKKRLLGEVEAKEQVAATAVEERESAIEGVYNQQALSAQRDISRLALKLEQAAAEQYHRHAMVKRFVDQELAGRLPEADRIVEDAQAEVQAALEGDEDELAVKEKIRRALADKLQYLAYFDYGIQPPGIEHVEKTGDDNLDTLKLSEQALKQDLFSARKLYVDKVVAYNSIARELADEQQTLDDLKAGFIPLKEKLNELNAQLAVNADDRVANAEKKELLDLISAKREEYELKRDEIRGLEENEARLGLVLKEAQRELQSRIRQLQRQLVEIRKTVRRLEMAHHYEDFMDLKGEAHVAERELEELIEQIQLQEEKGFAVVDPKKLGETGGSDDPGGDGGLESEVHADVDEREDEFAEFMEDIEQQNRAEENRDRKKVRKTAG